MAVYPPRCKISYNHTRKCTSHCEGTALTRPYRSMCPSLQVSQDTLGVQLSTSHKKCFLMKQVKSNSFVRHKNVYYDRQNYRKGGSSVQRTSQKEVEKARVRPNCKNIKRVHSATRAHTLCGDVTSRSSTQCVGIGTLGPS